MPAADISNNCSGTHQVFYYSTGHRQCQNETCLLSLQTRLLLKCKCGHGLESQCRNQKKVTISALFCIFHDILKAFSIRDITHATLEEEEICTA